MDGCTRCGHPYRTHVLGDEKRCRMRIAYDWNEAKQTFNKTCPCRCPGWRGVVNNCPHDYVPTQSGCVYCGHVPAEKRV